MAGAYSIPVGLFEQGLAVCRWCREIMSLGRNRAGHAREFCSHTCRQRWFCFLKHGPRFQLKECCFCSADFIVDVSKQTRTVYCSGDCRNQAFYKNSVERNGGLRLKGRSVWSKCIHCGIAFRKEQVRKQTCSRRCRALHDQANGVAATKAKRDTVRPCPWCGDSFSQKQTGCQKYCGRRCTNNAASQRRRARIAAVEFNGWPSARKLMKRDGPTCQVCGVMCILPFDVCNKQSATVDHIIPVFHGGASVASNARLLCLSCNARLGASICGRHRHSRAGAC